MFEAKTCYQKHLTSARGMGVVTGKILKNRLEEKQFQKSGKQISFQYFLKK